MASTPSSPAYTVLRIKRKATEAPLSQLVIENAPKKRVRDVSGRPRGVFRLAETVSGDWQGKGAEEEQLKRKITSLISAEKKRRESAASTAAPPRPPTPPEADLALAGIDLGSPSRPLQPGELPKRGSSTSQHQQQYRVVPRALVGRSVKSAVGKLPPKVLTLEEASELEKPRINFVDARAVTPPPEGEAGQPAADMLSSSPTKDQEMERFQSMLTEYLSMERPELSAGATFARAPTSPPLKSTADAPMGTDANEEYVYDLYYRDLRPSLSSTPLGLGVGDGVSMGALLGYEDISPGSSPADSEVEDEADEDSNDEDYYRNDYPEDEDADEDMVGYRDPYAGYDNESDDERYRGGESDDEQRERGTWTYR